MAQLDSIRLSGVTYNLIDSTAVHSLDGYYTTGETNAAITAATDALAQAIAEQGYQTATDVQNAISGKADSDDVYTKQQTDDRIDEKIAEASGVTTGQVQTMIDESISGKANVSDTVTGLSFQKKNGENVLLYSLQKNGSWSSGAEAFTVGTGLTMDDKTVKVDFTKVAKPSDIPSVTGYADSVLYDTISKEMKFYHGGTGGTEVFGFDASPFLIDGMVENVEIKTLSSTTVESGIGSGYQPTGGFETSNYGKAATKAVVSGEGSSSSDVTKLNLNFITSQGVETSYTLTVPVTSTTVDNVPSECTISKDNHVYTITPATGYKISKVVASSWKDSEHGGMPVTSRKYEITVDAPIEVLAITFNTDAGKTEIDIPLSQIFDANNYYTKSETDAKINQAVSGKVDTSVYTAYTANTQSVIDAKADTTAMTQAISEATSGKADTTAVTQSINEAVSGKVDTSTYTAYTADTATALNGKASQSDLETVSGAVETKQDELVSGTNIKTVGGNSLLGSGDIAFPAGLQVEVTGTTLIFS